MFPFDVVKVVKKHDICKCYALYKLKKCSTDSYLTLPNFCRLFLLFLRNFRMLISLIITATIRYTTKMPTIVSRNASCIVSSISNRPLM